MIRAQSLHCYVDETGQDIVSADFFVVAVVSVDDQNALRDALIGIEHHSRTGARKWHKSKHDRRLAYLDAVLERRLPSKGVFVGHFPKPVPYFLPVLETVEHAIKATVSSHQRAIVTVDGMDRKKAAELTNALRIRGIRLGFVRGKRDEGEPLLRLADMWAGCARAAFLGDDDARILFSRGIESGYLRDVTT